MHLTSAATAIHFVHEEVEAMVEDLKDADEAEAHAEADQTSGVSDEADDRHALVLHDQGVVRVLDEDVQHGKVFLGVTEICFNLLCFFIL